MKHRSLIKMFLLFVVTLGFYRLYWLLKTRKEIHKTRPDIKIASPALLLLPYVLLAIAVVMVVVVSVQTTNRDKGCVLAGETTHTYGVNTSSSSTNNSVCEPNMPLWALLLFYLACAAFLPLMAIWMWSYSKAVDRITEEHMSFALTMLILLLVPDGFDMLIVQDAFNKLSDHPKEQSPPKAVPAAA